MIDTHAHVHSQAFNKDRGEVLRRTWESGSRYLVEVNINARGWPKVVEMADSDPRIFITVGIHPHNAEPESLDDLEKLLQSVDHPKVVAIGETGLDYYRDYAPHDLQQSLFRRHVAVARETLLPMVVHARASHDDILSILEDEGRGEVRGVLHCFSGDVGIAARAQDLGFLLGFGGATTYNPRRSGVLVRELGLGPIVLETDCPYLTPHPNRRKRNEPANIPVIARALAAYLGVEVDEGEKRTDANAIRLFGLPE